MGDATAAPDIESPRLRRLLDEVGAQGARAVEGFWKEAADSGTPLVEPVPGSPEERLVTVVWRETSWTGSGGPAPLAGVYALLNRVTDKHLAPRGMMRRMAGTDLWYVSLRLPTGLRCSYRIHPFGPDDPHLTPRGPRGGSARGLPDDRADPLNTRAASPFGSMIELDGAPSLAEWLTAPRGAPGGRTDAFDFRTADGTTHRARRFVPDAAPGTRMGLLVLLDGDKWFDRYGVTAAVTAATRSGRLPPTAVLGIEAPADVAGRMRQLGANPRFVDTLADEVLPAVTAGIPGWAGTHRTVLCGQSLGGLTALTAALRRPAAFGTVLAQSPSTWWRPGMTSRPAQLLADGDTWLYEQFAAAPVADTRIHIDVGSHEGPMRDDSRRLHILLTARGFHASLDVYRGGHDHCCWAAALIEGVAHAHQGAGTTAV
ncbi:alpha/beta hydrolase-fold protein [Streptomyces sp. NPDC050560]|uniref:alpha/beta hydrolase-fold protein n=1 Tax=Streptomyces sp. NPDC050560 TaxID=3365630 RepID=UPI0037B617E5